MIERGEGFVIRRHGVRLIGASCALVAAMLLGSVPIAAGGDDDAETASLLFVLRGTGGSYVPGDGSGTLTLTGVEPEVTWFTDRPDRQAGAVTVSEGLALVGLDPAPPNAVLTVSLAEPKHDALALTLSAPFYDETNATLTFTAKQLERTGKRLQGFDRRLDETIASTFGEFALFVDDADTPVTEDGTPDTTAPSGVEPVKITIDNQSYSHVDVTPLWDGWNFCVADQPFPSSASVAGKDQDTITAYPNGGWECAGHASKMHWMMTATYPDRKEEIQVTNFSFPSVSCVDVAGAADWNVECGKGSVTISER